MIRALDLAAFCFVAVGLGAQRLYRKVAWPKKRYDDEYGGAR